MLCSEGVFQKEPSIPKIVDYLRESHFGVVVLALLAAFDLKLFLDVHVMLIWNFDQFIAKHPLVLPDVHARKIYLFVLQEMIEWAIPLHGLAEVVDEGVLTHA